MDRLLPTNPKRNSRRFTADQHKITASYLNAQAGKLRMLKRAVGDRYARTVPQAASVMANLTEIEALLLRIRTDLKELLAAEDGDEHAAEVLYFPRSKPK